ncbi:unnamed protein product [Closterium sp. Naga37s-1]|nr:unnamed protein product [Closterium sp. Naga37s-1]
MGGTDELVRSSVFPSPLMDHYCAYSRDFFQRGRIRVQLKKPDNTPHNPDIPNKMALMLKLGELIPKHVGRSKKDKEKDKEAGGGGGGGAGGSHGAGGSEKKGKGGKKRR